MNFYTVIYDWTLHGISPIDFCTLVSYHLYSNNVGTSICNKHISIGSDYNKTIFLNFQRILKFFHFVKRTYSPDFKMNSFFALLSSNKIRIRSNERVGTKLFFITILSFFSYAITLSLHSKETFKTLNSARVHDMGT